MRPSALGGHHNARHASTESESLSACWSRDEHTQAPSATSPDTSESASGPKRRLGATPTPTPPTATSCTTPRHTSRAAHAKSRSTFTIVTIRFVPARARRAGLCLNVRTCGLGAREDELRVAGGVDQALGRSLESNRGGVNPSQGDGFDQGRGEVDDVSFGVASA